MRNMLGPRLEALQGSQKVGPSQVLGSCRIRNWVRRFSVARSERRLVLYLCRDGFCRKQIIGWTELLSETGAKSTIIDGASNLEQQISATS